MRFLLDQDVYAITTRFLKGLSHDVITAATFPIPDESWTEVDARMRQQNGWGRAMLSSPLDLSKLSMIMIAKPRGLQGEGGDREIKWVERSYSRDM